MTTVPNELDQEALTRQRKNRKIMLFAKLGALGFGVALTVVVVNVLLFPMIVVGALIALLYGAYVLFIKESPKPKKIQD
ncbi:MAG: hypothetical protein HC810_06100 [Acaryochloridaceae cyanobacterium RL_2_7]|nr:hypothetical protein [Acaryochloridaceae cyanobacterium RL_2_7]